MSETKREKNIDPPRGLKAFFVRLAADPTLAYRIDNIDERARQARKKQEEQHNELMARLDRLEQDTERTQKIEALITSIEATEKKMRDGLQTVDDVTVRFKRIEHAVEQIALRDFTSPNEIEVPLVNTGIDGRLQLLEERLEAVQTRIDVLTLGKAERDTSPTPKEKTSTKRKTASAAKKADKAAPKKTTLIDKK